MHFKQHFAIAAQPESAALLRQHRPLRLRQPLQGHLGRGAALEPRQRWTQDAPPCRLLQPLFRSWQARREAGDARVDVPERLVLLLLRQYCDLPQAVLCAGTDEQTRHGASFADERRFGHQVGDVAGAYFGAGLIVGPDGDAGGFEGAPAEETVER